MAEAQGPFASHLVFSLSLSYSETFKGLRSRASPPLSNSWCLRPRPAPLPTFPGLRGFSEARLLQNPHCLSATVSITLHIRPRVCPVRSKLFLASSPGEREGRHQVIEHMTQGHTDGKWQGLDLGSPMCGVDCCNALLTPGECKLSLIYFCQNKLIFIFLVV